MTSASVTSLNHAAVEQHVLPIEDLERFPEFEHRAVEEHPADAAVCGTPISEHRFAPIETAAVFMDGQSEQAVGQLGVIGVVDRDSRPSRADGGAIGAWHLSGPTPAARAARGAV
jgi:hypothetical protein